jgi:catechol 2,3-dioxygenase-like lactoylglutathione lyase family enzyme
MGPTFERPPDDAHYSAHVLHHLGIRARDFATAKAFYTAALRPLGIVCFYEADDVAEFGHESGTGPSLSLHGGEPTERLHLAFGASDASAVDAFYAAALGAGGRDNGPRGPRPQYRAYCAFVFDPDGNNIEALVKDEIAPASRSREPLT